MRVFCPRPLITPKHAHSSLQMFAVAPATTALCPCRARVSHRLTLFVPSNGAQAPLEPRHSASIGRVLTRSSGTSKKLSTSEIKHPSLHSQRDVAPTLLQGTSPVTGETPATAIAGLACSAAIGLFAFHRLRAARSAMDNWHASAPVHVGCASLQGRHANARRCIGNHGVATGLGPLLNRWLFSMCLKSLQPLVDFKTAGCTQALSALMPL